MKTVKEQQMESMQDFATAVSAGREDTVPTAEFNSIMTWYKHILDSATCINMVRAGAATIHWNAERDEPEFSMTTKGAAMKEAADAEVGDTSGLN